MTVEQDLSQYKLNQAKARALKRKERAKMKGQRVTKPAKKSRVGKLGIVRLVGEALGTLRWNCFSRDNWKCVMCGTSITWNGECSVYCGHGMYGFGPRGEMAHVKSRGAGGSDTLENVRTLCPSCHRDEHNAGGKPCKKRVRT